jgi:hypothetical protein
MLQLKLQRLEQTFNEWRELKEKFARLEAIQMQMIKASDDFFNSRKQR